jgi:phage host-nuclease inhibitor protein Gam
MAAPGGDVFEEHLGVIEALKENYMRRDDAMTVANINSLREQVAQLCRAREDEVKDAIKGTFLTLETHGQINCHVS